MLYLIFYQLLGIILFKYITFRSIYAAITAMTLGFLLYPYFERKLKSLQFKQTIKEYLPETHKKKKVPTMGGLLIITVLVLTVLLWNNLSNPFIWLCLLAVVGFGIIGFVDDYIKARLKNPEGLSEKRKFLSQVAIATVIAVVLFELGFSTELYFPIFKNLHIDLGYFFIPWVVFIIVGASNAVNLTDGLDGLAIGPVITTSFVFLVFSYIAGNVKLATYLNLPYVPGAGELAIVCAAIIGASLVFLWFNTYPAEVFMGDVGSLSLGALLGTIAIITKEEFILAIAGGVFVLETLSVIVQRYYFKYTKKKYGEGKRIFKMAPLHHHFEKKGWEEPKITVRFWIISIILALIALSLLKIR
ncbi:Phospho-N-acetylmuramoyl-pentapeptide-transferase [Desulfurobacterium thermolithotrophum DSM 11699]|uniref:Phospho-N-acetylmuramoyl-pentapeptide-transferase n=1 Tax=Desulfurobacterium thermolithotrophum (strain DSM 11699 / BSA) TaxID=868864 RepID=F0S332_DESTD|nr:phospho-N-acetylmuramoyl-pentapeptide-transferase [Desulfurobacterium thermolithotrophum]ADY73254.1 Phospho-N-acetylmuramoyl-pentapeptide-transferase [Desulfurobacterium thermolithotrophum DSM 11699]